MRVNTDTLEQARGFYEAIPLQVCYRLTLTDPEGCVIAMPARHAQAPKPPFT